MGSLRDIVLTVFIFGVVTVKWLLRPWWGILLWTWVGLMNPHKMTWSFAYNFPFAMIIGIVTIFADLYFPGAQEAAALAGCRCCSASSSCGWCQTIFCLLPRISMVQVGKGDQNPGLHFLTLIVMQWSSGSARWCWSRRSRLHSSASREASIRSRREAGAWCSAPTADSSPGTPRSRWRWWSRCP